MLDLGKPLAGAFLRQVWLLLGPCVFEVWHVVSGTPRMWQTKSTVKQLQNWVPALSKTQHKDWSGGVGIDEALLGMAAIVLLQEAGPAGIHVP